MPPRIGDKSLESTTAVSLAAWLKVPSPVNDKAAAPILPGAIHCGGVPGMPISVPLLVPTESIAVVPLPSSK